MKTGYSEQADTTLVQAIDQLFIKNRFKGHTAPISSVAFAPDGLTALSGAADAKLILWDVANTDSQLANLILPTTGDYRIEIQSSYGGQTFGAYPLVIELVTEGTVTPTHTPELTRTPT